jgi:putative membrane protein
MPADPRVFFAAERTQLAWLRTGITVMGFGFVIARFGLFLRIAAVEAPALARHTESGASAVFGVVLVGIGTAMVVASTIQYRHVIATLPPQDRPHPHSGEMLTLASSVAIAAVGAVLAGYLLLSAI